MEKAFEPSIKTEFGGERRRWMELLCEISNLDVEIFKKVQNATDDQKTVIQSVLNEKREKKMSIIKDFLGL